MNAPRWFFSVVSLSLVVASACLIVIAMAAWRPSPNGRYAIAGDGLMVLDTRTGYLCGVSTGHQRCWDVPGARGAVNIQLPELRDSVVQARVVAP